MSGNAEINCPTSLHPLPGNRSIRRSTGKRHIQTAVTARVATPPARAAGTHPSQAAGGPAPGSPGWPPLCGGVAGAQGPVLSEFDLAAAWDARPLLSITGTRDDDVVGVGATPERRMAVFAALPPGNKAHLVLQDADHT
ncbi:MAG TPA: hypothetical protein PLM32_14635, partial [Candidatus Competibacter sp.]|nr:hypothetical protein [Candidatus Competibacter sp.]